MKVFYSNKNNKIYLGIGNAILNPVYDKFNKIYYYRVVKNKKDLVELGML